MSSSSKKVIQGELEVDFETTSLIVWYYVESKEIDEHSGSQKVYSGSLFMYNVCNDRSLRLLSSLFLRLEGGRCDPKSSSRCWMGRRTFRGWRMTLRLVELVTIYHHLSPFFLLHDRNSASTFTTAEWRKWSGCSTIFKDTLCEKAPCPPPRKERIMKKTSWTKRRCKK